MKKNYTHISVVLDRSGSMASMVKDVIGGFNTLVEDQVKIEGEATMTVAKFDTEYEIISDFTPISDVPQLNSSNFQPRGSTALLDAMGKTMNDVRERINQMPEDEKPSKALFVFMTDGEENASKEYNRDRVFEMIADLKTESEDENSIKWDFVFIGANQDAIQAGGSYGIRADASLTYAASGDGATRAFASLSRSMSNYRVSEEKGVSMSFCAEDRKDQEELDKQTAKRFDNCIPYSMTDLVDDTTKKV